MRPVRILIASAALAAVLCSTSSAPAQSVTANATAAQKETLALKQEVERLRAEVTRLRALQTSAAPGKHAEADGGPTSPADLQRCGDAASREPVRVEDFRAETQLALSVREHANKGLPVRAARVETWCGTWWDCCYFSHAGPATGLVGDCYSVWVQ